MEVKWGNDWWHAKVIKMKPPKGGELLHKVWLSAALRLLPSRFCTA